MKEYYGTVAFILLTWVVWVGCQLLKERWRKAKNREELDLES